MTFRVATFKDFEAGAQIYLMKPTSPGLARGLARGLTIDPVGDMKAVMAISPASA